MSRSSFQKHFKNRHAVLPVIHPVSREAVMRSVRVAVDAGVDGVFLINQGMRTADVLALIPDVSAAFPDLWIGLNVLGMSPADVLKRVRELPVRGIWSDDAGCYEDGPSEAAAAFAAARDWDGLYFGGVAFKYRKHIEEDDLAPVTAKSLPVLDVVTTSGAGTGKAADMSRVFLMRKGAGDFPMAIASGITPDNVTDYLPLVDALLVATGIEAEFGSLDIYRTTMLVQNVRAWRPRA